MNKATVELKAHERGAEVDLDVRGLSLAERLSVVVAAVRTMISGHMHVHLIHALIQSRTGVSLKKPSD